MQSFTFSIFCLITNSFTSDPLSKALGPDGTFDDFPDRSRLDVGIGSVGKLANMAPVSFSPNQNADLEQAYQAMSAMPNPSTDPTVFIDPNLLSEVGFVSVSEVFGDGPRCAADNKVYTGRCSDRAIKFHKISKRGKQHWVTLCGFQWPCQTCPKNYSDPCPIDWDTDLSMGPDSRVCIARTMYVGPCERRVDFSLYNDYTKQLWSEECLSYWPCA